MLQNCNEEKITDIQRQIRTIYSLLSQFSWLADAFVLDFFVESHWERLPKSWQQILDEATLEEFAIWLDPRVKCPSYKHVWPLSLQALRVALHANCLNRKVSNITENLQSIEPHAVNLHIAELDSKELYKKYKRHIKTKKLHEISRLAEAISSVLADSNCKNIVDIGSGQGHLSRILALVHGYKVVSIEAKGSHVHGARKYDMQALKESRLPDKDAQQAPCQFQVTVEADISEQEFEKIIVAGFSSQTSDQNCPKFALVGLHTCGNLASTMQRLFLKSKHAITLVLVPCCYMKITQMIPMSSFLKKQPYTLNLSYAALEVACHAIEMHADKLRDEANTSKLKVHCYRACLEQLIRKFNPQMRHLGLSVKNAHTMTFSQYAERALLKGNLSIDLDQFLDKQAIQLNMSQWKRVISFYSLRIAIAPLIESLILLDRMLHLLEKGISCVTMPIFDAAVSPRNQTLIAVKQNTNQ